MRIAIVVELFCGSGHFARAMEEHRPVLRWDILMGPDYDLTKHAVQILFFGWLRAGWVCAVWMGTPCNSFSMARNQHGGRPALRDKDHFNGLQTCDRVMRLRCGSVISWHGFRRGP